MRSAHLNHIFNGLALVAVLYALLIAPPADFPAGQLVPINEGASLSQVAFDFKELSLIRYPLLFEATVTLLTGQDGVKAGDYYFKTPASTFEIAQRVVHASYGLDPIKITIPEGVSNKAVARILDHKLPAFDPDKFLELAQGKEGYLFPETYFFLPNSSEELILIKMEQTFHEKIATVQSEIAESGREVDEIVIMASLLEGEARTTATRQTIAGILWKRLDAGMRLQVDAVFPYIMGKNTFQLTREDLRVDSPYNTYLYKGLPAGAINNPGLNAILAAANPQESSYWFYLSDMRGNMHYATNFENHKANKKKYLP